MFISKKRHQRELDLAKDEARRATDDVLACIADGVCVIGEDDQLLEPISRSFASLFGRRDVVGMSFHKLLTSVLPSDVVTAALEHLKILRTTENVAELRAANPLANVRARLLNADGSFATRHLSFAFRRANSGARLLVAVVGDITEAVQRSRELEDLRGYSDTQTLCLSSVVRLGVARFNAFLQRTDTAMTTINIVLKKPARESEAFQEKLQEILAEIRRIALDAKTHKLEIIERQAREFEASLEALCARNALSGTDFLPLAVQLDRLFAQLALMRSLTSATRPSAAAVQATGSEAAAAPAEVKPERIPGTMTENGTQIMAAPRFELAPEAALASLAQVYSAPPGSLESTLVALTDHVAQTAQRNVTLHCAGLESIPPRYQALIKNISIQLIRNAVKHGIETAEERIAAGKLAFGKLSLDFRSLVDGRYDFSFEDDGRGLDAEGMRGSAVANGLISAEEARQLPDRQAIKLLFKAGVSTEAKTEIGAEAAADAASQRGLGMATVRRLVADANGKIALSTVLGQQTRFKITLPPLSADRTEVA